MSSGRLRDIVSGVLEGVVKVDAVSVDQVLGGVHSNPRHRLYYLVPFQGDAEVGDSFVEIFAHTRRPEMTRWRIWFDGVAVTREYKPNYTIPLERGEFSITVINVTPLVKRSPGRGKHKLVIVNEGSEPIELLGSIMVKTYLTGRGRAWLTYSTGGLRIDEGEQEMLPGVGESPGDSMTVYSTPLALSSPLRLELSCETGSGGEDNQVAKVGEMRIDMESCGRVRARSVSGSVLLPSIVAVSQAYDKPEPVIEGLEVAEGPRGHVIRLSLANRGSVALENGMVTVFALGEAVARSSVDRLEPGEGRLVEMEVRLPREARSVVVRVIWNEYGEPRFMERKLSLS